MLKRISLAVALAFGLAAGTAATAATQTSLLIDPDGGGAQGAITVGGLDWSPSSALSITPFVTPLGSQLYSHAQLATFNDTGGQAILLGTGGTYQWTFVTGFLEAVTSVTNPGTQVPCNSCYQVNLLTIAGGENFFRIYSGTGGFNSSNNLAGTGFSDGLLILEGTVRAGATTTFNIDDGANSQDLDQFNGDSYAGQQTYGGIFPDTSGGDTSLIVDVSFAHPLFFLSNVTQLILNTSTKNQLAFQQTDPSGCFTTAANTLTPGAGNAACGASTLGRINAAIGPDNVQFETDAASSFLVTRVPEPGTLLLFGLGLLGVGITGRRKILPVA